MLKSSRLIYFSGAYTVQSTINKFKRQIFINFIFNGVIIMINNLIRVSSVLFNTKILDIEKNKNEIISVINKTASSFNQDILVFPAMCITGKSAGSLISERLCAKALDALSDICKKTEDLNSIIIVGLPLYYNRSFYNVSAVIKSGKILAFVPSTENFYSLKGADPDLYDKISIDGNYIPIAPNIIFNVTCANSSYKFSVIPERLDLACGIAGSVCGCAADFIINPSSVPALASNEPYSGKLAAISALYSTAVINCNLGGNESTSQYVYDASCDYFVKNQNILSVIEDENNISCPFTVDLDLDIIREGGGKTDPRYSGSQIDIYTEPSEKIGLLNPMCRKNPYIPEEYEKQEEFYNKLFHLQVKSIAMRLKNTGIKKTVIGISGGLDSTLALLVLHKAAEISGGNPADIIGVTMPGFGTTGRTYNNARALMDKLQITSREISIKDAVTQHLNDISHDINNTDTVYENAQARERQQILFDLANEYSGIVIGTGDLSEAALGFCTFGGDHLSGYNVNSCLTKNMIRGVVSYAAKWEFESDIAEILEDILETPVSPELLPLDENGSQNQKTEEFLGSYELHDFFLYYLVKYKFSLEKIYRYALNAFDGVYDEEEIRRTLGIFAKRFVQNQFKRSCSSESAVISEISLAPSEFLMPSDIKYNSDLLN